MGDGHSHGAYSAGERHLGRLTITFVLVLIFRPTGLLGKPDIEKV